MVRNQNGRTVDPVPFFVVVGLAFLLSYSYLTPTLMALGQRLAVAVVLATASFVGFTALTYYRFVWTARPDLRGEIPSPVRLRRLTYEVVAVLAVLAALGVAAHLR